MTLLARLALGLALALATATCAFADARAPGDNEPAQREVLVMLRLPADHLRPSASYGGGWSEGAGARRRIAQRLASQNGLVLVDSWPMPVVGVDCFVLRAPPDVSPAAVAARLSRSPQVAWSQPMNLYRVQGGQAGAPHSAARGDPLLPMQPAAREWRLTELHRTATGRGVRVAVIDSQIEQNHPDLVGQVVLSENFVSGRPAGPETHGTAVAGIIAAIADNGIGIAGVAPGSRLLALRACWQGAAATLCDSLSLAKALDFAIGHGAQVINLSLSGPPDILLGKLLDAAKARRAVVVAAFDPNLPGGGFPASHPGVVAVADESAGRPPAGVQGAPGRDVPATLPGGKWGLVSGSSFAAAEVSGLAALVRERPGEPAARVLAALPAGGVRDACATLQDDPLGASLACPGGQGRLREAAIR
ncbi:MAG TPA: S8 family serine peptidase [Caulobacteraceae bacterium]|jgi:subtilisin family serine protease|nr:S8 family serine peptidase [Caulobacteraceae bacterium]